MIEIKNENVIKNMIQTESELLVLDFYATWCGPCRTLTPKLKNLAEQYQNVKFCKIDVDVLDNFSQECKISCMPTLLFVKNGEVLKRIEGANIPSIIDTVKQHA